MGFHVFEGSADRREGRIQFHELVCDARPMCRYQHPLEHKVKRGRCKDVHAVNGG